MAVTAISARCIDLEFVQYRQPDSTINVKFVSKNSDLLVLLLSSHLIYKFASNDNIFNMAQDLNRIKVVLVEQKKTGKWLAEQLGVSACTVSRWASNTAQLCMHTVTDTTLYEQD